MFFSRRRRHTRWNCDWSSDVCSSDLTPDAAAGGVEAPRCASQGWDRIGHQARPASPVSPEREGAEAGARLGEDVRTLLRSEERRVGKEWRSWWGTQACNKERE